MWWIVWFALVLLSIRVFNKLTGGRCYADTVMTGNVAVVTGASGGIGYETALELARRGARVVLACRSGERGRAAVQRIHTITKNSNVRYSHLDLTSLASIRRFVREINDTEAKLDVLVNNAGAICTTRERTEDGIPKDMQINHFGPFLLTVLLVPLLKKSEPSRVVVVSSAWHKLGRVGDFDSDEHGYIQAYANSKLCNVLFCKALARRLEGTGVVANCLNPGQVNTRLYRSSTALERVRSLVLWAFFKSPAEGAQTSVYLAVSDDCDQVSGRYFEDCREAAPAAIACDVRKAEELWALSERLVRLAPEEKI